MGKILGFSRSLLGPDTISLCQGHPLVLLLVIFQGLFYYFPSIRSREDPELEGPAGPGGKSRAAGKKNLEQKETVIPEMISDVLQTVSDLSGLRQEVQGIIGDDDSVESLLEGKFSHIPMDIGRCGVPRPRPGQHLGRIVKAGHSMSAGCKSP